MKAKTLTDKLQQLPAARHEQVEARAAELVAEEAHNRDVKDVKGAAMTPEQMKQRAAKLSEVAYTDCTPRIHREMLAILRAVAGGEVVGQVGPGTWEVSAGNGALVIQGGEDDV